MAVRALIVALLLITPSVAHGDVIGPACWRFGDFGDSYRFRLFFMVDPANPTVASVAGQNFRGMPLSGNAYQSPDANVHLLLTIGQEGFDPGVRTTFFINTSFPLSTLEANAQCQNVKAGNEPLCGDGFFGRWVPIACP